LDPVVEACDLRVLDLSEEHMFEATGVILSFSAIQPEPNLVQLLTEFIFVRRRQTLLCQIARKGREEEVRGAAGGRGTDGNIS
jgi:hypothetical protein